jgi:hypothetical protein
VEKDEGAFHLAGRKGRTAWCAECRSANYYERRYPEWCERCGLPRKLDRNGRCVECNDETGIRWCRTCERFLLSEVHFHGVRRECAECRKAKTLAIV